MRPTGTSSNSISSAKLRFVHCALGPPTSCSLFYQIEQLTQDLAEEEARAEKISSSVETARVCDLPPNKLDGGSDSWHRCPGSPHSRPSFPASAPNSLLLSTVRSSFRNASICFVYWYPVGIGCAGEIQIAPHEDYAQWAIDILVKFRDNEKLQLLTGQRQSGGVRHCLLCVTC